MDSFDIKKYLDIAIRRKYWIIIPFLVILLAGFFYILKTPKIYQASTLILVQAQKVPENYVRSVVSSDIEDRLRTIQQQVTSRTNLESIIEEHQIYGTLPEKNLLMEEKVELFRKQIAIDVTNRSGSGESAFSISFQGKDAKKVAQVANALASNFISENLKIRESQAIGTSDFLTDEMESIKNQLMEKEEELKAYKQKYIGGLPEELDSNLSMLTGLRNQLEQLNNSLRSAEDRKLSIQQGIAAQREVITSSGVVITSRTEEPDELSSLKNELASLQTKYTDNHPDIIQLKRRISTIEENNKSQQSESTDVPTTSTGANQTSGQVNANRELNTQVISITQEITRLKAEIQETKTQIRNYEIKVEETPKREQELLSINRDYDNVNALYNSMLNRKLESDVSVNLEKKQKGEQFKVLDSAKVPVKPIKPDVQKLGLLVLALGLGAGCGLAYMVEMIDTSYRGPEEIEKEFSIPVLVNFPVIHTEIELKQIKRKNIFAYTGVSLGFILSVIGILLAVKGVSGTIDFFKSFFVNV